MLITDNLNCLIRHCDPESVLKLLKHQSAVTLLVIDPLLGKRKQRIKLVHRCKNFPQAVQVELDKAGEKILCLTDNAGKDAMMYACEDLLDDVSRTRCVAMCQPE